MNNQLKAFAITTLGVSIFAIPTLVLAWTTNQSASAECVSSQGAIKVSFTNTESSNSKAMNVIAQDNQTNKSLNLGTVNAHETKTGEILTGSSSLNTGTVTFHLSWANGTNGTDVRTASYNSVSCHVPTPTPTNRPTPTPTNRPTPTPTPRPTVTPTATPTPTPKPTVTPTITPTATPTTQPTVTPTPTAGQTANGNNNDNTNTNVNGQNNSQSTNQTQNNTQNNGSSSSSSSSSDNNISINNTNSVTVEAATAQQPSTQNTTVEQTPSNAKELPKTGPENIVYSLFSLFPLGLKLRKWAK